MGVKRPSECLPGEQLGEDLYIKGSFYATGTELTSLMIQDLRRSKIKTLFVLTPGSIDQAVKHPSYEDRGSNHLSKLLPSLIDNMRYGQALHHYQDTQWLEELYGALIMKPQVAEWLNQLKHWNFYSYLHSVDVFILCTMLAKQVGVKDIESFALGCLLHDIGKLKVPMHLLEKEGKLTALEYEMIQTHTFKGEQMLREGGFSDEVQRIARSHHERLDGSGYPHHVNGDVLDTRLKIIMIADVYSALTLNRSYRKPIHGVKALEMLLKESDKYDLELCHAFMTMLDLYPDFTEVLLTDGRTGTIVYKKSGEMSRPFLKLEGEEGEFSLEGQDNPSIQSIVGWKSVQLKRRLKKNWYNLLRYLTEGKKLPAIKLIDQFSDDMRIETIYMDIIEQIYIEIEGAAKEKKIDAVDEHVAYMTLMEILNFKMIEDTTSVPNVAGSTVLASFENTAHSLPLKMIDDVLTMNGWQTFYLGYINKPSLLIECIHKYQLSYVTLYVGSSAVLPDIQKMITALRKDAPSLSILLNGPYAYHLTALPSDVIQSYGLRDYISKLKHLMNAS